MIMKNQGMLACSHDLRNVLENVWYATLVYQLSFVSEKHTVKDFWQPTVHSEIAFHIRIRGRIVDALFTCQTFFCL